MVLGALVQTLTGFAMGLIIMAGVALFSITDIAFAAAVVSFISLANAGVALRHGHRYVDWPFVGRILLGLIPAMALGIVLLTYLSEHFLRAAETPAGLRHYSCRNQSNDRPRTLQRQIEWSGVYPVWYPRRSVGRVYIVRAAHRLRTSPIGNR